MSVECYPMLVDSKFTSPYADQIQRPTLRMFTPSTRAAGRTDYRPYAPNRVSGSGGMPGKIFINYRREDARSEAARIRDRLITLFGPGNIFMDIDDLKPGQRFDAELTKALSTCDAFLAVIGPRWYDIAYARAQAGGHDYVREEIATALARDITLIPILIDHAVLPHPETLPDDLRPLVLHQAFQVVPTILRPFPDIAWLMSIGAPAVTQVSAPRPTGIQRPHCQLAFQSAERAGFL
jgi:hypothetical protein